MRKLSTSTAARQAGFTLIELVIVIVIIGILAAVAIPKLTSLNDEATKAKNTAILGSLKSTWSIAYAVAKAEPTAQAVAAQMADPTCTSADATPSGTVTCTGADTTFGLVTASGVPSWSCTTATMCL